MPLFAIYHNRFNGRAELWTAAGKTFCVGPSAGDLRAAKEGDYYDEMPKWFFPRSCASKVIPGQSSFKNIDLEKIKAQASKRQNRASRLLINACLRGNSELAKDIDGRSVTPSSVMPTVDNEAFQQLYMNRARAPATNGQGNG